MLRDLLPRVFNAEQQSNGVDALLPPKYLKFGKP